MSQKLGHNKETSKRSSPFEYTKSLFHEHPRTTARVPKPDKDLLSLTRGTVRGLNTLRVEPCSQRLKYDKGQTAKGCQASKRQLDLPSEAIWCLSRARERSCDETGEFYFLEGERESHTSRGEGLQGQRRRMTDPIRGATIKREKTSHRVASW